MTFTMWNLIIYICKTLEQRFKLDTIPQRFDILRLTKYSFITPVIVLAADGLAR
jgi:hypothetical protein